MTALGFIPRTSRQIDGADHAFRIDAHRPPDSVATPAAERVDGAGLNRSGMGFNSPVGAALSSGSGSVR